MSEFKNILAVIQRKEDAAEILRKARTLATMGEGEPSSVHVVRVVYEGVADLKSKHIQSSTELKKFILSSEETWLEDVIDAADVPIDGLESATVWHQKAWRGVLDTAERVDADLIVKIAAKTYAVGEILRTPDDWNLVRHATIPVLLSQPNEWPSQISTLAAVDVFDDQHKSLNERILRISATLSRGVKGPLHIASAYPMFEPWMDHFAGINSYRSLRADIESDIKRRVEFFAKKAELKEYHAEPVEGNVQQAMQSEIERLAVSVLVLGTKARTGVEGFVLGNTAEKLLYHVNTDVLCVP